MQNSFFFSFTLKIGGELYRREGMFCCCSSLFTNLQSTLYQVVVTEESVCSQPIFPLLGMPPFSCRESGNHEGQLISQI